MNIVNAEMLMRDRGIQLKEQRQSQMGAFSSSITAQVEGDGERHVAAGTLFGNNMPRLIRLGDYRLEAYLDGNLLVFTHEDVPGIIGSIGTVFGSHNINIAQMAVGRMGTAPGGSAIGVLNLDDLPSKEALAQVEAVPGIHGVQVIQMPPAGQLPPWLQSGQRSAGR